MRLEKDAGGFRFGNLSMIRGCHREKAVETEMSGIPVIIFDTSAINRLAKELHWKGLVAAVPLCTVSLMRAGTKRGEYSTIERAL